MWFALQKIRRPIQPLFFVFVIGYAAPSTVFGDTVVGSIGGTVSGILENGLGDAPDSVSNSDAVTIDFVYDSTATPSMSSPTQALYGMGIKLNMTVTIGANVWEMFVSDSTLGAVTLANELSLNDQFLVAASSSESSISSFPNQLANSFMFFQIDDTGPPAPFLSSIALPTSLADINLSDVDVPAFGALASNDGSDGYSIQFQLDPNSLSLTSSGSVPVPEPSMISIWLLALGAASLALTRRCVKTHA